jgi:hypothetical protein
MSRCLSDSCAKTAPKLAAWMEENLSQGFPIFSLPASHQHFLGATVGVDKWLASGYHPA